MTKPFFDRYPQFFETSSIGTRLRDGSQSPRLHNRYFGIIEANRSLFADAAVLDIGSHDGRWSLAALDAGAKFVTGIEGRKETKQKAERTLNALGGYYGSFYFICGDALETKLGCDVILCLGFMYHTPRHWDLFNVFARCGARHVILDTKIAPNTTDPVTQYMREQTKGKPGCALSESGDDWAVVGVPSEALIYYLAAHFGFKVDKIDYRGLISDWRGCTDYRKGVRCTYRLTRCT